MFTLLTLNRKPLYVHVTDARWDGYGTNNFWGFFLQTLLEKLGGIGADVPNGWYDFNVERIVCKFFRIQFIATLVPHVE